MKLADGGWHRWFAWRPVRVENNDLLWLQWVEKKYNPSHIHDYRRIKL